MTGTATTKQIDYAIALLDRRGFDTRYMNASFSKLGAKMRERSGTVEAWLSQMSKTEISKLISSLKAA